MKKAAIVLISIVSAFTLGITFTSYQLYQDLGHHFAEDVEKYPKPSLPYEEHMLKTRDGLTIASWYIKAQDPKAVVILIHGYDPIGAKSEMLKHAEYLYEANYSTLLIDLRGNGKSSGNKVSLGVDEWKDVEAAYDYVKSLPENKDKQIGFLGESMGASTAIITKGLTGKGDFIIADVPFANYKKLFDQEVYNEGFGWLPLASFLTRTSGNIIFGLGYQKLSPDRLIKKVNVPILITWSENDEEIGPQQGSYLYELANQPKEDWETDLGHDITDKDLAGFKERALTFLSKYIKEPRQ